MDNYILISISNEIRLEARLLKKRVGAFYHKTKRDAIVSFCE